MRYLGATVAALLAVSTIGAQAEERSPVEVYLDLTIARLQLILDTWAEEDRPPTGPEEAALCEEYGFSAKEYYKFSGTHRKEIDAYLESNPDIADEIEYLSQQIQGLLQ
jgi:hypothetical protein